MISHEEKVIQTAIEILVNRQVTKKFQETDYTISEIVELIYDWYDTFNGTLLPVEIAYCIIEFGDPIPDLPRSIIEEVVQKYS